MHSFEKFDKEMDQHWKRATKAAWIGAAVSLAVWVLVLGGVGFVVYKLLQFWGVL